MNLTPKDFGKIEAEATHETIKRLGHLLPDDSFSGVVLPTVGCAILLIVFAHLAGVRESTGLLIDSCTLAFGVGFYLVQRARAKKWRAYHSEVFNRLRREASDK